MTPREPLFAGAGIASMRTKRVAGAGYQRIGEHLAVPDAFTAEIAPQDPSLPVCRLRIVYERGEPSCVEVAYERRDRGPGLTSALLRRLPLGAYVREAVTHVSFRFTRDKTAGVGRRFELEGAPAWVAATVEDAADDREAARETVRAMRRQPRRGIPVTDDDLREVAAVYRQALSANEPPTEAVKRAFNVGRATASRWIARAREAGYLGAARPGRAGEFGDA